ncbi:hypothetical protein GH714_023657 [Hevea brasiliensis]|uniref:Sugar phosphate transporter domain-containing protein n=1 Tax=Hevea brasiliensis TaxID=3981 RepID=A0A6A6KTW3_HEVBR|nr:hypothetical protein GH714_023657 [Hevea brasiliensis]
MPRRIFVEQCVPSVNQQKDIEALEAEKGSLIKSNKAMKKIMWNWKQKLSVEADSNAALVPLARLKTIYGEVPTPLIGDTVKEDAKSPASNLIPLFPLLFDLNPVSSRPGIPEKLDFKFPLSVSCVHFICSSIGAYIVIRVLKLKPLIVVDPEDRWRRIFPMSFVFCINIVLGNVSLRYIPVSFMQTIKSFTPATTGQTQKSSDKLLHLFPASFHCILVVISTSMDWDSCLQWLVWRKYFDWRIWASLVPIVGGILLTSVTELSFNMFGFCAALFGCLATSTKTILAESLLHGYKFDSINTVYYMAPFATMILGVPAMLLEGNGVLDWFYTHQSVWSSVIIIFSSGVLAFFLNFSIFYVIHSTTAVTFNVAGNLKVAVAVMVSWLIFRNPISALNAVGCGITLVGCTFYGYVRHMLSQQPPPPGTPRTPRTPRNRMELLPLVNEKLDDKV